jgi:hypothetical protein
MRLRRENGAGKARESMPLQITLDLAQVPPAAGLKQVLDDAGRPRVSGGLAIRRVLSIRSWYCKRSEDVWSGLRKKTRRFIRRAEERIRLRPVPISSNSRIFIALIDKALV